ncbi:MAG: enoyl-CoA hydratase, partial [Sulfitobacter sp.]
MSLVLTNNIEGVTTVTLNRPEQLNALSNDLRSAITETFLRLKNDDTTKVIVLTGSGRAFSAGLDLRELGQKGFATGDDAKAPADLHGAIR